ncbi:hypothetical protein JIX56_33175 [Streptomyces sp. CA-210063]|uniref:hypothetical protein n=1 Tax=Streptomyces sp. CA-210063 TaxID=2801029 RepID=UPI00214C68B1|nr:hypothetical protein [Streptomyces sp. CA-210063]UUU34306.1 hypothetical protein JIX56_33175 [Streptomyces sp. CA-210063]
MSEPSRPTVVTIEEPRLATRRRERRRIPRHVLVALPLALAGLISLLVSGNALRPFERVITIEAKMASKSDYFKDPEVQRLLLKHGIRVDIQRLGSRGVATQSWQGLDVVFPSGQPAAKLILRKANRSLSSTRPFVTPLVLATFRDYAETLEKQGVAVAQKQGGDTLYYNLEMNEFVDLLDGLKPNGEKPQAHELKKVDTWHGLGFDDLNPPKRNSGRILVRTSSVCESNSAGTYLSILSFVENGNVVPVADDAEDDTSAAGGAEARDPVLDLAKKVEPLISLQGMWADEQADSYFSGEGESIAPIAVIYEHQYLAHQLDHHKKYGKPDTERVLLYPTPYALTEPQLIALTDEGEQLVELIRTDTELRRRATELGFRVRFSGAEGSSDELNAYLREHGIQEPARNSDQTKVDIPDLNVLEKIINEVGDCPPVEGSTP